MLSEQTNIGPTNTSLAIAQRGMAENMADQRWFANNQAPPVWLGLLCATDQAASPRIHPGKKNSKTSSSFTICLSFFLVLHRGRDGFSSLSHFRIFPTLALRVRRHSPVSSTCSPSLKPVDRFIPHPLNTRFPVNRSLVFRSRATSRKLPNRLQSFIAVPSWALARSSTLFVKPSPGIWTWTVLEQ